MPSPRSGTVTTSGSLIFISRPTRVGLAPAGDQLACAGVVANRFAHLAVRFVAEIAPGGVEVPAPPTRPRDGGVDAEPHVRLQRSDDDALQSAGASHPATAAASSAVGNSGLVKPGIPDGPRANVPGRYAQLLSGWTTWARGNGCPPPMPRTSPWSTTAARRRSGWSANW